MKTCDQLQTMALTYAEICRGEEPWVALGNFMSDWFDHAKDRREQLVAEPITLPSQPRGEYCGDRLFENKYEFAEAVRQLRREQRKRAASLP
jgi:hypothetical protein